jgi:hypothetical protein
LEEIVYAHRVEGTNHGDLREPTEITESADERSSALRDLRDLWCARISLVRLVI